MGRLRKAAVTITGLISVASPAFGEEVTARVSQPEAEREFGVQLAQSASPLEERFLPSEWQFKALPYVWAISIEGDSTVKGQDSDVDIRFKDILEQLNFGVFLEGEARKERFGLFANVLYADLETDQGTGPLDIEVGTKVFMGGGGASYRLGPYPLDSGGGALVLDPYAGFRYTLIDVDLDISGQRNESADQQWVDPIVGLRSILQLTPRWNLTAFGDVGGFGVGSDFTWQAAGVVGYRFGLFGEGDAQVLGGYRAIGQDYSDGDGDSEFKWDVVYHGPVLGLSVTF